MNKWPHRREVRRQEKMALREAGRIAYQEGKSRDACCHLGILDQLQWDMGWELARLEDESNKESQ